MQGRPDRGHMGPLLDVYVQRNSDKDGKYLIANWDSLGRIQAEVNSTRVDKGVTLVLVLDQALSQGLICFITILHFYGIWIGKKEFWLS